MIDTYYFLNQEPESGSYKYPHYVETNVIGRKWDVEHLEN